MKVLFAVDGSAGALEALRQAGEWLSSPGDSVAFYYSPPMVEPYWTVRLEPEIDERFRQSIIQSVFAQCRQALPMGLRGNVHEIVGTQQARRGICLAAQQWNADLIVVGARGLGTVERWLLGSVSAATVHSATVPVFVARDQRGRKAGEPLRVLLAYDRAESGLQAAELLYQFTWPAGTVGRILSIIEPAFTGAIPAWLLAEAGSSEVEHLAKAWIQEQEAIKQTKTDEVAAFHQRLPEPFRDTPPIVVEGNPADKILEVIDALGIHLVVLGARPLGGAAARWLAASTSDKVLHHAACSVLIVHQRSYTWPDPARIASGAAP